MTTSSVGERGSDPIVGSTLDHYHFVRRIGVGGMGIVYLVEHTRLKKMFAAKVLLSGSASKEALAASRPKPKRRRSSSTRTSSR